MHDYEETCLLLRTFHLVKITEIHTRIHKSANSHKLTVYPVIFTGKDGIIDRNC